MGKRLLTVLAVIAFLSGVVLSSLGGAADKQEAPDTIEIQAKLWTKHTKGPVKFEHKKHQDEYKIKCDDCHHVYEDARTPGKRAIKSKNAWTVTMSPQLKAKKSCPRTRKSST